MTKSSESRIKCFVDWFIRSEEMQNWTSDKDSDFINEPERATRCADAAELGADGKTHAEVIEDWRECFDWYCKYGRKRRPFNLPRRFMDAVNAHFDSVESWHDKNGSLHEEIG